MSSVASRGAHAYRQAAVEGCTPLELVLMLYDGVLRFAGEAREAIRRRDIRARSEAISRALAIVGELQATLDMERGGDLAASLDALYAFVSSRLVDASFRQDVAPLDEAVRVLSNLREGWGGIASQTPGAK